MATPSAKIRFPDPAEDISLKSLGLAVLSLIIESVAEDSEDAALQPVLADLAEYAATLPPKALFDDWAPSAGRHALPLVIDGSFSPESGDFKAVDGGAATATASSQKNDKASAAKALCASAREAWSSVNDAAISHWQVQLRAATYVQYVEVNWRNDSSVRATPESYTLSVSNDGTTWSQVGPAVVMDALGGKGMARQRVPVDAVTQWVRVDMKGYSKGLIETSASAASKAPAPKEKAHGLASVRLFVPDTLAVHVAPGATLFDLEKLLYRTAVQSTDMATIAKALTGLQSLALASGSAQGLLKLVSALVALQAKPAAAEGPSKLLAADCLKAAAALPAFPKTPAATGPIAAFARGMDEATNEQLETLLLAVNPSGGARGGGRTVKPAFDPGCMSSGVTLSEGDTLMTSTSSRTCVYGTIGFRTGKVAWEFKSVTDGQNDEYLCFGCGIKPKVSDSYDSGSNLWMIRGYNGRVHQHGSSGRTIEKVHPNDIIRFELDCEAGTVRAAVNGVDQGIVFDDGLIGQEVFPAMCTYNSNRAASFIKLEILSGGAAAAAVGGVPGATPLSALPALATGDADAKPATSGHVYLNGQLEEGEGSSSSSTPSGPLITVAGLERAGGISLRPEGSSGSEAHVTFPLQVQKAGEEGGAKPSGGAKKEDKMHKPYEYLVASVGVDDSSPRPAAAGSSASGGVKVAPVVLVFELDGRPVYTSMPLSAPGETHFIRLPVKGAGSLKISARPAPGAPKGDGVVAAKAVICDALVAETRDWSWSSRRTGMLPGFKDSAAAGVATSADGEVATLSTPLSMARFVLSRLAFLAEAQNEVTRRGQVAAAKIARITATDPTSGLDTLLAAAAVNIAAAKEKAKKPVAGEKPADPSTILSDSDVFAAEGLRRLQSPLCLDVCAATLTQLRALLHTALPFVHAENADVVPTGAGAAAATVLPQGALGDAEDAALSASRPWTAVARYTLALVKAHLRRLVASQVDPAMVGISVGAGSSEAPAAAAAAAAAAKPAEGSRVAAEARRLRAAVAGEVASRGDVTSTHTRGASGSGAISAARAVNPLAPVPASANKGAVAALDAQFRAGSVLAPGAGAESTLAPLHRLLQLIVEDEEVGLGGAEEEAEEEEPEGEEAAAAAAAAAAPRATVRSRLTPWVQSAAADAIDAGLSVLYPTQAERRQLLAGLVARGGVVEVQFRFPATRTDGAAAAAIAAASSTEGDKDKAKGSAKEKEAAKEKEEALKRKLSRDPRPDRALILLQLECQRAGIPCHVYGLWGHYMHVVVKLAGTSAAAAAAAKNAAAGADSAAAAASAVDFLDAGFSRVFARAGLGKWTIPTGCAEPAIPLKIERVLDPAAPDRSFSEGVGLVRIYPRSAGTFTAIDAAVQGLVAGYGKAGGEGAAAGAGESKAAAGAGAAKAAAPKKRVITAVR